MISLIQLILEDKKELPGSFKNYECVFLLKFIKSYNKKDIMDRVRGVKNITIVEPVLPEKTKRDAKYEFSYFKIKFNTNQDPQQELETLVNKLVHLDKSVGDENIVGLVSAKPIVDTLNKEV